MLWTWNVTWLICSMLTTHCEFPSLHSLRRNLIITWTWDMSVLVQWRSFPWSKHHFRDCFHVGIRLCHIILVRTRQLFWTSRNSLSSAWTNLNMDWRLQYCSRVHLVIGAWTWNSSASLWRSVWSPWTHDYMHAFFPSKAVLVVSAWTWVKSRWCIVERCFLSWWRTKHLTWSVASDSFIVTTVLSWPRHSRHWAWQVFLPINSLHSTEYH
jgi:hypothetical protein